MRPVLAQAQRCRGTGVRTSGRLLAVSLGMVLFACSDDARPPGTPSGVVAPPSPIRFVLEEGAFHSGGPGFALPFEILPTDFDADGDVDLWINWHVVAPFELWENRGGSFVRFHPSSALSGLWDNPGIRSLFATTPTMVAELEQGAPHGLYLWHDSKREGNWNLFYVPEEGSPIDFGVRLVANQPIDDPLGLRAEDFERGGSRELRLPASTLRAREHVAFHVQRISTQLELFLDGEGEVPVFVGPDRTVADDPLSLWKPDPHGVAFVDVCGGPEPELYLSRGGLRGQLRPPLPPKRNYLYLREGGQTPFTIASATKMPADYGRSRRVEWVDVDSDGDLELYVGNRQTPNAFWCADADGDYHDRAGELGLDLLDGDRFAWFDIDSDGREDLVAYSEGQVRVGWNLEPRFEWVDGATTGLVLPAVRPGPPSLFEELAFHVLDFDNDGQLDLWISGHGPSLSSHLFVRRAGRFEDASERVGLHELPALSRVHWSDLDGDGYQDAVGLSSEGLFLLHNARGREVEVSPLGADQGLGSPFAVALADADGDGRDDLFLLAGVRDVRRLLLLNATEQPDRGRRVLPQAGERPPVGAVVRAHYSDGSTRAQRHGSAHGSGDSQTLLPLHFGSRSGIELTHYTVTWPGSPARERFEVGRAALQRLVRGGGRPE